MSLPRLRAPQGDGEILAHPPLAAAADLAAHNRSLFAESHIEIDGVNRNNVSVALPYVAERDRLRCRHQSGHSNGSSRRGDWSTPSAVTSTDRDEL